MTRKTITPVRTLAGALLAAASLGGCGGDAPLDAGAAAPPDAPSRFITPACEGTGGETHPAATVSTQVTWSQAGSPHRVTGRITIGNGGRITIQPGAVVCFSPGTEIEAGSGGRLVARGTAAAPILLTARDPARDWEGLYFYGTSEASYLTNVRIEHVHLYSTAVYTTGSHPVIVDSTVIRQSGHAAELHAPGSRVSRSRVDTTTNRAGVAVRLGSGARFEASTVRGAAGTGVRVSGTASVQLLGGRIEGSGGTGLLIDNAAAISSARPVRVTGGRGYGAELPVHALAKVYASSASLDSLRGNARDTLVITGGTLRAIAYARAGLPWIVRQSVTVSAGGELRVQAGARLVFEPNEGIGVYDGGILNARGSRTNPVVFTADDPNVGWSGLYFEDASAAPSRLVNARVEYTHYNRAAVHATGSHAVVIDSSVIRMSGQAALLYSANSRISRSRVDSILSDNYAAVELGQNAKIESTLIRASSGAGLEVNSATAQVVSCEIRGSVGDGILLDYPVQVHDCNLVGNLGVGIRNRTSTTVSVTGNWWGDAGGPAGPGGDGAAGPLTFAPWRTAPYVLPYVP